MSYINDGECLAALKRAICLVERDPFMVDQIETEWARQIVFGGGDPVVSRLVEPESKINPETGERMP